MGAMTSRGEAAVLVDGEVYEGPVTADLLERRWGIGLVPWLWATRLRILFVIDGRINEGRGAEEFGLGFVLETLRDPSFAWWVRFEVEVVRRDEPRSFRFTETGFDIDNFDQVWFFGDWPGGVANDPTVGDDVINNPEYSPLSDDELRIVAEWMGRGGGVFATGDHSLLGASMCYRIPRVRTMRKWTRAQGVPSFGGEDRHESFVRVPGGGPVAWEGDRWPQQIFPVYRQPGPSTLFGEFPHPVLCGQYGVIDTFPDHMHEGGVIEDDDVELNRPLDIPGFQGAEYPVAQPEVIAAAAPGVGPHVFGVQPRPQVIAHGLTTSVEAEPFRFGLISVYDGDPVKVGRVVVDSTWHHWLSLNLVGFRAEAPGYYRRMQDYYRNVGLWLATPGQRASMLFAATWGALVGKQPGLFSRFLGLWDLGERALDVIGRTAPQCIVSELVATFLVNPGETVAGESRRPTGRFTPPMTKMVNQAIVGGIGLSLVDLAHHHIVERAHGRVTEIDRQSIRDRGLSGVADGQRALIAALDEFGAAFGALRDGVERRLEGNAYREIPIDSDSWEPELGKWIGEDTPERRILD
jgi:hypothetical protein